MTRINIIEPKHLTQRHLVAEYKEITQFVHLVGKRVESNRSFDDIPKEYTLGKGHCKFFYDKGAYIIKRINSLYAEMLNRSINTSSDTFNSKHDRIMTNYTHDLMNDYTPTSIDYKIVIDRISQRILEKPLLYKDSKVFFDNISNYI